MSNADRRVIALGNLAGELKTSLEAAARAVGLELLLTREPARAFVELERDGALAVLVDMATLGAEQFCKRARGTDRLRSVPVIGMSRHPNELGFARVFAWGADDLVPLGARLPLERRLQALRDTPPPDATGFGQAVVAEATTQRRALVGRVLAHAGYDVKFAVDRGAVELYASQSETRLVVISAALGDPRRIIEAAAKAGALPTWIVTVEARSTQRLAASLLGLDRVAVTSTAGSPEDVLFLANELVFSKGARRREWRALYATPVAFRAEGSDADEYGFSYDASPSGLYVRSLLPCMTDDVEVELRLPNRDERVRLAGKVARRFAFGSGAIASAPPGFSVKLEGPEATLKSWTDACEELISAASSSESMPPRPRSPSQPVLASPGLGGKETPLAVPPATVSIESVVAPLPVTTQAALAEGSDVGELLAATLDEETLAQVGTRPVTIDSETLGVREERPSEFAINAKAVLDSIPALAPLISDPPKAPAVAAIAPMPVPAAPSAPMPVPAAPSAPMPVPAAPLVTPPRISDTKTPLGGTVVMKPKEEPPPPSPRSTDWESDAKTAVRASQPALELPRDDTPTPNPRPDRVDRTPQPAETTDSPRPPEVTYDGPLPAFSLAPTEPPPAPESLPEPAADTVAAGPPMIAPASPARAPLAVPSTQQTLPMGMPKQAVPLAPPMAATLPSTPSIARAATKAATAAAPSAAEAAPRPRGRALLYVAAAVGATAIGMGLAVVTRPPEAEPAPAVSVLAPTSTVARPSATAASTVAPTPSAAPTVSAARTVSAAPTATPSTTPAPVPVPVPVPVAPAPEVDLRKLGRERAALLVHSSANTHVFVHGADYGATNQVLITSCGIRFVRLGRALGDFLEPGQSYVLKCGKLNELTIEPAQ